MPKIETNIDLIKKIILHLLRNGPINGPRITQKIDNNEIIRKFGDNAVSIVLNRARDTYSIRINLKINRSITLRIAFDLNAITIISAYVLNNGIDIGYDKIRLDKKSDLFENPYIFDFLNFGNKIDAIHQYKPYFELMLYAIAKVINQNLENYIGDNGTWDPLPMAGGKKNIKNNLKTNTVLELKSICKKYKIKNYSKLNKDDLISLIKKNKKLLNK